jgi:ADP-ribosylglycohydrolase
MGYANAMLPHDHEIRMQRTLLSLDGLSVGDSFGECFLDEPLRAADWIAGRQAPPPEWCYTDDTTMALSIVRCLRQDGHIEGDELAQAFAREYAQAIWRGYGGTAHKILRDIYKGKPWRIAAGEAFGGEGSCGNGGAMRAAPIGAYVADDLAAVVREARASAEVTHAHADGQAGAIAVALAAAWMVREGARATQPGITLVEFVLEHLPDTATRERLSLALRVPRESDPRAAARLLGNGSKVIASDTVPFCLWCAAWHRDYQEALWAAVRVGGDIDTNCAIIGGIVALAAGRESIPAAWLSARESFEL